MATTATLDVQLRVKTEQMQAGFKQATAQTQGFLNQLKQGFATGAGISLFGKLESTVKNLFNSVPDQLRQVVEIGHAAERVGASMEAFSGLASRFDPELLEKSFRKLSNVFVEAGQGSKEATAQLAKLGIVAADLAALPIDQKLMRVAEALKGMSAADRLEAATKIFGGKNTGILTLLNMGAAGIQKIIATAKELGLAFTEDDLAKAKAYTASMRQVKMTWDGFMRQFALDMAPTFARTSEAVAGLVKAMQPALKEFLEWTSTFSDFVTVLATSKEAWGAFVDFFVGELGQILKWTARIGTWGLSQFWEGNIDKDFEKTKQRFQKALDDFFKLKRDAAENKPPPGPDELPNLLNHAPMFAPALIRGSVEAYSEALKLGGMGTGNRIDEDQLAELVKIRDEIIKQHRVPLYEAKL